MGAIIAVLVAALALLVDLAASMLQRVVVSPGLTGKTERRDTAKRRLKTRTAS